MATNAESTSADRAHVFHFGRPRSSSPRSRSRALGGPLGDNEGNEYVDFSSQLVNLEPLATST
ncbi:MAG: hypothetical protein R2716_03120 [Microthrixaceae bacterium]